MTCMPDLGNDDILWPPASKILISPLSWAVVYFVVFARVCFAFVVVDATFGYLVHKFILYLSLLQKSFYKTPPEYHPGVGTTLCPPLLMPPLMEADIFYLLSRIS